MRMRRFMGALLMVGVVVLTLGVKEAFASGTATGSAVTSDTGLGETFGQISKPSGVDTGAMTITEVKAGEAVLVKGTDYEIVSGTDNSTRPKIKFLIKGGLPARCKVEVSLKTVKDGTFDVNLKLSTS